MTSVFSIKKYQAKKVKKPLLVVRRQCSLSLDKLSLCRWNPIIGDRMVFVKHDWTKLDLLDTEKKVLITKEPIQLQREGNS